MNNVERVKKWRKANKQRMIEAMGRKCQCCGYDSCAEALAFHHIDPSQKDIGFGGARSNPKAWSKLVTELRKCILVCHNCHSEIHAGVREMPESYELFNEEYAEYKETVQKDKCSVCGTVKSAKRTFCSQTCARKNSRKVDWDTIDLLSLLQKHSISELGRSLGVSAAAIYKRRNKIVAGLPT